MGTAGAFGAALLLFNIERQERQDTKDEQRQAQARLVSVWCTSAMTNYAIPNEDGKIVTASGVADYTWAGILRNASNEPVFELHVAVGMDLVKAGRFLLVEKLPRVLPPQEDIHWDVTKRSAEDPWTEGKTPQVEVVFADAAGRYWHRDSWGHLREVRQKERPGPDLLFTGTPRRPPYWPDERPFRRRCGRRHR